MSIRPPFGSGTKRFKEGTLTRGDLWADTTVSSLAPTAPLQDRLTAYDDGFDDEVVLSAFGRQEVSNRSSSPTYTFNKVLIPEAI